MAEPFVNERLLRPLRVHAGRRQVVLHGDVHDYFMVDFVQGLRLLEDALRIHAAREGFEVVVFLDKQVKPRFLTPEMSKIFDEATRRVSEDPQAGDRQARVFNPRARRGDGAAVDAGSTGPPPRAQEAAQQVSSSATSAEQATLDQVTRLLSSDRKCLVVFTKPEQMWPVSPTIIDLRKLETVVSWCWVLGGHPRSLSVIIVTPNRLEEFTSLADRWGERSDFTSLVQLRKPSRRELECFLRRVLCRFGLLGDVGRLIDAASARQLSLYTFSERVSDFLRDNPTATCLDSLFDDEEQIKTLDQLLEELNELIGLCEIKKMVFDLIKVAKNEAERRRLGQNVQPLSYHMFFLGNPGTGKTIVARLIGQIFWAVGLRSSQAFVEISPSNIISAYNPGDTIQNMKDAISRAIGGVLFIDEVYGLAEDEWGRKALETLMKEMEDHRDNLTVIMAGYEEKLPDLFKVNPGFKSRVNYTLRFPDYSTAELLQMFDLQARKSDLTLAADAHEKLSRYIDSFNRIGGIDNGRGVRNVFEETSKALMAAQSQSSEIQAGMIPDPICFREAEAKAILEQLDKDFIGLRRVKDFFKDLFIRQRAKAAKGENGDDLFNHCLFLGNPGTGKTTVARRMGQLYYFMGLVSKRDHFVEIDPINDMTSKYQSEYSEKVRKCFDRAVGGVLFIDEAYQLAKDEQGKAVIDQIVKLTTEPRYRNLVVIMAGYTDSMQDLYKNNQGLKRRFPHEVPFDDFTPDELATIFGQCLQRDKHEIAGEEGDVFDVRLRAELKRLSRQRYFGNAGAVQNLYGQVKVNQEHRLDEDPTADRFQIRVADLTREASRIEDIDEILKELDRDFVGLQSVKDQIGRLARRIKYDRIREERRQAGVGADSIRLYNMRFTGSPGTGKTTIARYMSRVYYSLGITSQPKVREIRGVDLKGSYVGQTKDKVNELFETSCGQVVIIDEIYGVQSSRSTDIDSYGQEAIDTLVGCITDLRNEGTVIILAGYKDQMEDFLKVNPGLASRFPSEVEFPDYSAEECAEILYRKLDREKYEYPKESQEFCETVVKLFTILKQTPHFGNARTAGSIFERLKDNLDQRLAVMNEPTEGDYFRIEADDLYRLLPQ